MWLKHYVLSPYWYHAVPSCMAVLVRHVALAIFWQKNALILSKTKILGFPEMASNDVGQSAVLF